MPPFLGYSYFHHFLAQKMVVLNTLATWALRISDKRSFEKEKSHLLDVFVENGYSIYMVRKLSSMLLIIL